MAEAGFNGGPDLLVVAGQQPLCSHRLRHSSNVLVLRDLRQGNLATLDDVAGPGLGFVDVFSPGGRRLQRLEHGSWLSAPWGVALAPGDFGAFSHHLLVGHASPRGGAPCGARRR